MLACQSDQIGIVKLLLEHKADPNIRDQKGWTANDHAIMGGFHGCSHLIEEQQTMKRASAGSALSGTGLFGSTTNSVDVLGFPLGGPAASDSGDNEEDLSINKKSDDDSWAASNSEFDEPAPKKGLKLSNVTKVPSLESFKSEASGKDRHQHTTPRKDNDNRHENKQQREAKPLNRAVSPRSGSEGFNEEKPTPRRRTSSKGLISSGTISDWDDDSDILDDLSDKKSTGLPLTFGSNRRSNEIPNSPSPIQEIDERKGAFKTQDDKNNRVSESPDVTPRNTRSQVKGQQDKILDHSPAVNDDVFDENSDSNWESEADDILPSDNSIGNAPTGYTPSQVQDNNLANRNKSVSPVGSGHGAKRNGSPISEEENSFDETDNEEEEEPARYRDSSQKKVHAKDEDIYKSKDDRTDVIPEMKQIEDGQLERSEGNQNGITSRKSLAELEMKQNVSVEDHEQLERERKELEEDRRRQEQMFEERLREVKAEQEEMKEKRLKQVQDLEAEKKRVQDEAQKQRKIFEEERMRLEEESRRKEEDLHREMERKLNEAKEMEIERLEEEKQKMQDELMAERHRIDEERRRLEERRILQEENETEMQESKENEEFGKIQADRQRLEEEINEQRKAVEMEKEKLEREGKEERNALRIERQKLEEDKIGIEKVKAEAKQIEVEKKRLEEKRMALEDAEKDADDIKRERERLEEEKNKIDNAWKEVGQMQEEKRKLEQERKKLEAGKADAEKLERERQKMEDERKQFEEVRKEAERIEIEKRKLGEERQRLADKAKKDAEQVQMERVKLNEEREELQNARQEAEQVKVDKEHLEEEKRKLDEDKRKVVIEKKQKEQFEMEKENLKEEKKNLEAVKRGETNLVEFERQKLEREKEQLIQSRKEDEERMKKENERLEGERRELEKIKRKEKELRENVKMKLQDEIQQMKAKQKEEENNMRNMQAKIKELTEKNMTLENRERSTIEKKEQDFRSGEQNGHMKEAWNVEPMLTMEERQQQQHSVALDRLANGLPIEHNTVLDRLANGLPRGEQGIGRLQYPGMRNQDLNGSEVDSEEAGELIFDANVTGGLTEKPRKEKEEWYLQGLLGGAAPRSRRSQKKMRSLNVNGNGSPSVHMNNWQELLDEYDGLDYSSSSMGDGDEDDSIGNLSPVTASTPMVPTGSSPMFPAGSLPISSTFQLSQTGGTTHFQNIVQDLRYKIAKEKQSARLATSKLRQISDEKQDILMRMDDINRERQELKDAMLQMEKKLQTFTHEIELEREKRCSAELLLKKTKDQMTKKDHQLSDEQHTREQAELALCKLQVDYQMSQNAVQQLEAERDELHHQLIERENSRKFQQKLMDTQQMKQEAIYETGSVVLLEAADESRKAAWSQSEKLKEELFTMKVEMERLQFKHKGNEGVLTSQILELESKLADLRQEQIVSEDALHHASQAFHAQLTAVKIENSQLKSALDQEGRKTEELNEKLNASEKENREKDKELQDLDHMHQELERNAKSELDKMNGYLEKKQIELNQWKDEFKSNEKMQRNMEDKISRLKQQLGIANASLLERTNQLKIFQQEMDKKLLTQQGHDKIIHMEREEKAKALARAENLTESLRRAEQEMSSLKATMESLKTETHQKEWQSENHLEKLNSTISAVQKEKDQVKTIFEEKQTSMAGSLQTLKDSLTRSESDLRAKDGEIRFVQQQLNEAEKKLCISDANMAVLQKAHDNQEREIKDSKREAAQLNEKISNLESVRYKLESQLEDVQKSLRETERKFVESSEALTQAKKSLEQQEVDMRKMQELEREKAKLEVVVEQEKDRTSSLKKELEHTIQMKNNLEVIYSELRNTNVHIGEQLSVESAARNLMSQEVEDHKELWESEIKSKSKLGLRLAQLQRFRVNQQGHIEEEKRKTVRALEVKKQLDGKLESEKERNHQLSQTVLLLKSKLKLAKRRLKELEVPEAKIQTLQTEFERERFNFEAALATQRKQLENCNEKLESEMTARQKLEKKNASAQLELASLQSLQKKKSDLMKANKNLENELAQTKKNMHENYIEKKELELYKNNLDLQTKVHLNERLAQVNNYLDEQTSSRDLMDKTQQNFAADLRNKLEESLTELKSELASVKSSKSEMTIKKETLETELQRCKALFKQECEKGQRLEEELENLQRKVTELESRVRIEQQKVLQQRSEPPHQQTASPQQHRQQQQQRKGVDDIAHEVREELNRSISRHMEGASAEFDFQIKARSSVLGTDSVASPGSSYLAVLKKNYFV
ncbi:uncharacterized protein [Apostichopus japonicus]